MKPRSRKKKKSAAKLTARESAFLKNLETSMTITSAARSAGYSQRWHGQAGAQAFRNIKKKRPKILDELGCSIDAIIERLKPKNI